MSFGSAGIDDRIGLSFTDGSVRYFFRSTLANAGGYFSARFGNGVGEGLAYADKHNQLVYAMERDGALFAKYIEPFILTRKSPHTLPTFSQNPELWRALRGEIEFYGLDDLTAILRVTYSCPYIKGNDQGILHWLGTEKGKSEYQNPQATGAIAVHVGKVGDLTFPERDALKTSRMGFLVPAAFAQESRQALVQYMPQIIGFRENNGSRVFHVSAKESCFSLWCNLSRYQIPTIVDLKSIKVRLTAYSFRYDQCGMTDWNFEGSEDGKEWVVLHEARNDRHVAEMNGNLKELWNSELRICADNETRVKISQEFAERERRHTWQINPPSPTFFRFFRIIGSGTNYERHEDSSDCLHGVGLELYGDVHEE